MSLLKSIQKVNELYRNFKENYDSFKNVVKNHSCIHQKIVLSEQFLNQAFMLIKDDMETVEGKREFNKIVKGLK